MKRRDFLGGVGAVGAAGALSAPSLLTTAGRALAQGNDIPVGLLFSLTGAVAVVESTLHDAALMAIEEVNAAGGVHGRQLRPIIEDPASDPATYADRARRLMIRDKCVSVFGSYTSASRQAVLPVTEQRKNLYWYPTLYEGRECSRNVMYGGAVPNQQQDDLIPWAIENFGPRFYMIGNNSKSPSIVAIIGYENPSVLDLIFEIGAHSVLMKPVRAAGVLSSMLMAGGLPQRAECGRFGWKRHRAVHSHKAPSLP